MDIDFGYGQNGNGNNTNSDNVSDTNEQKTDLSTGTIENDSNGEPAPDVNDITDTNQEQTTENQINENGNNEAETNIEAGMTIDVDGQTYTVDNNGNVLDANGNIYKEASEVQDWIKSFDTVEEGTEGEISINSIRAALGVDIYDDNDKPVEFDNTPEGIKAYIDAVIESGREEIYNTAVQTIYNKYPFVGDAINYYLVNGNSLEGYQEQVDWDSINMDSTNEVQQEEIIKLAWRNQQRKGDVDNYIQYLKTSGTLAAVAQEELNGLREIDENNRRQMAEEARQIEEQKEAENEQFWNEVYDVVQSRRIGDYQIPDSIIVERNGQKYSATPEDFFNYVYRIDNNGYSAYTRDLANETRDEHINDQLLRAYIKFTGGSYSNLVDMAINKQKVNTLKLRAKERRQSSIRITKPANAPAKGSNIDLGYN